MKYTAYRFASIVSAKDQVKATQGIYAFHFIRTLRIGEYIFSHSELVLEKGKKNV